jgi:hypothetical protein
VPTLPAAPSLFTPTIPAVPTLPTPNIPAPALPSLPGVGVPQTQDLPAGSAQQLMAQLKNLISDLENSASANPTRFRPMPGLGDLQPPIL